jgi:hypothetical protein
MSVAGAIEPGSTLVVLRYARDSPRTGVPDPLRHESSRLAAAAGAADVGLYEAATPYFQVTFDGGPQLWRQMAPDPDGLEKVPPQVDLAAVRGQLDYVVVVGRDRADESTRGAAATRAVDRELAEHYERVAVSSPTGLAEVWRARGG